MGELWNVTFGEAILFEGIPSFCLELLLLKN